MQFLFQHPRDQASIIDAEIAGLEGALGDAVSRQGPRSVLWGPSLKPLLAALAHGPQRV